MASGRKVKYGLRARGALECEVFKVSLGLLGENGSETREEAEDAGAGW